ncbi:Ada metal-binding domain-containing protein [Planctomycetota bacterium]
MKAVRYTIALTAVVGFLTVPVQGRIQSPSLSERLILTSRPHPALVGIDGFRAILFRSGADPGADGLDWAQLKVDVTGKLNQEKIKLFTGTADGIENIPELRVYVNLLKLGDSKQYVFRIQTSVARSVCLKGQESPVFKADLWMLNLTFEVVSVNNMPARITEVVLGQIKAFIRAYRIANPPGQSILDTKTSEASSQNPTETDTRSPSVGHGYVASNSSDIFHKPECRWAKNISPENLVTYKSREQAVKAGKRPCKWCKP